MTNARSNHGRQHATTTGAHRWSVLPGNRLRRCHRPAGGPGSGWVLERGDGLNLAIETIRQLRPHVPYSVSLLSEADTTRIANVRSFADALRLAQAPATELERSRKQALTAYEAFKQAARATLQRTGE